MSAAILTGRQRRVREPATYTCAACGWRGETPRLIETYNNYRVPFWTIRMVCGSCRARLRRT